MSTITTTAGPVTSTKQKVGLVLCGLYCLSSIPSVLESQPDGEEGPPMAILVLSSVLGVIGLVAVVAAWRGSRLGLRVAAGALIVSALTGLPAFFVDVPAGIKLLTGVSVLVTIGTIVLMFSPARRPAPSGPSARRLCRSRTARCRTRWSNRSASGRPDRAGCAW